MTPKFSVQIEDELQDFPTKGLYLLLIFQHDVFPHLAILKEGKYWSLSTFRVHRAAPGLAKWNSFKRKKLRIVCFEIIHSPEDELNIQESFEYVNTLNSADHTCLGPVLDFFCRKAEKKITAEIVTELIPELQKLNFIRKVCGLNIPAGMHSLAKYSRQDVVSAIAAGNLKASSSF